MKTNSKQSSWLLILCCSFLVCVSTYVALGQGWIYDAMCMPLNCGPGSVTPDSMGMLCVFFPEQGVVTCRFTPGQACLRDNEINPYCSGWIYGTSYSCHQYFTGC